MNDSRPETYEHITQVRMALKKEVINLLNRADQHDQTKLVSPQVEYFDKFVGTLKNIEFGSPEHEKAVEQLTPALEDHYAKERHHPQHYLNGIQDMSLLDLLEMLCDWMASTKRMRNGNIRKSIEFNLFILINFLINLISLL